MTDASLSLTLPPEATAAIARQVVEMLGPTLSRPSAAVWLDVAQAAAYLQCKPQRIYDLVSQGRLPVAKEGSRSLFKTQWLDALLEIQRAHDA
jgi:excisionase family DNA binding protein